MDQPRKSGLKTLDVQVLANMLMSKLTRSCRNASTGHSTSTPKKRQIWLRFNFLLMHWVSNWGSNVIRFCKNNLIFFTVCSVKIASPSVTKHNRASTPLALWAEEGNVACKYHARRKKAKGPLKDALSKHFIIKITFTESLLSKLIICQKCASTLQMWSQCFLLCGKRQVG